MGYGKICLENFFQTNRRRNIFRTSRRFTNTLESMNVKTAGILIIGDEVLKGHVTDTNSSFITKKLFEIGVKVKKIVVVGDDIDMVAKEVKSLSPEYTYVITTGGIGPTHDDITFEAIAKAFNETTQPHPELVEICKRFFKTSCLTSPAMKLAHVPQSSKLNFGFDEQRGRHTLYPCVSVKNVYIFPGVPQLMERSFSILYKDLFRGKTKRSYVKDLYLLAQEFLIADILNQEVKKFPNVTFGSYPQFNHSYYRLLIIMESEVESDVLQACHEIESLVGKELVIQYDKCPLDEPHKKIVTLLKQKEMKDLGNVFRNVEALCRKYRTEDICLYLDGSKGSTALLHMLYACMNKIHFTVKIKALYVDTQRFHPEVLKFIREAARRYDLDLEVLHGEPSKLIRSFLHEQPTLQALIVPICDEDDSQLSKKELIELSQIAITSPLEEWSSSMTWKFIRSLYLPYCTLYDRGYSSIKSMVN